MKERGEKNSDLPMRREMAVAVSPRARHSTQPETTRKVRERKGKQKGKRKTERKKKSRSNKKL